MDPYGDNNRKILSPLDKVRVVKKEEAVKIEPEEGVPTLKSEGNEPSQDDNPSIVSHLTDLRKQLVKSVAVFLFFLIVVFSTINFWFPYITRGHKLIILGPLEVVKFYMSISASLALGLSLPFLCHFLWQFVKPGLNEREGRFLSLYSPVMLLLFLIGVSFGYFVVNPLSYNFLVSLGAVNFNVMVSAQEYVSFLLMTTMPIGLMFELPIVALFLATIGILTTDNMKKVRKWSYLTIGIVSALITPPDFISQLLVLIPMALLYEVSILLVKATERRIAVAE